MEKMKEQLDRKECILQELEAKVFHYEKYLKKKSNVDKEAVRLLHKFQEIAPLKEQKVTNVIEDNIALRNELRDTLKEVNMVQRINMKRQEQNEELKETIKELKKGHSRALTYTQGVSNHLSPRVQKAHFDSEAPVARKSIDEQVNDDWKPIDLKSLKKIAERFPNEYAEKLEVHLLQH